MFSLISDDNKVKFFDKHLKKVKELTNKKTGQVHFRRWKIVESRWFNIYIHQIKMSDTDKHLHNHPWSFISYILQSGYFEKTPKGFRPCFGGFVIKKAHEFHKIQLIPASILGDDVIECWSFVITGRRINPDWGYLLDDDTVKKYQIGAFVTNDVYRQMKLDGKFNDK